MNNSEYYNACSYEIKRLSFLEEDVINVKLKIWQANLCLFQSEYFFYQDMNVLKKFCFPVTSII